MCGPPSVIQTGRGWPGHQQAGVAGTGSVPKSPQWRQLSIALPGSLALEAQIGHPEMVHGDATTQGGRHGGLTQDPRVEGSPEDRGCVQDEVLSHRLRGPRSLTKGAHNFIAGPLGQAWAKRVHRRMLLVSLEMREKEGGVLAMVLGQEEANEGQR